MYICLVKQSNIIQMTRLEQQIAKMQEELNTTINFAKEKNQKFIDDLNFYIIPALAKYKVGVINPEENTFVDKSLIGESKLYYRVYLNVDLSNLSEIQKKNLEKSLRTAKVPMPICPISNNSISLVYHD